MVRVAGGVDIAIGRRDHEHALRAQHPAQLVEHLLVLEYVLDHLEAHDHVEAVRVEGQLVQIGLN